ncbi:AzlC family protein [Apilactobacillus ozensis DSM 23829 = JCM 17196]|uniref:AzlC family protein n=1 Tax=Apilactobacillus ozensis DSM 23829 = JCM 17196 TaxID=1423781 RepID=A0A0R2AUP5_9LACO|nr:AzlC family ABC transporter permease [Apilactobacillus ozensis]KRM67510.1 AzlC family protein [Apilactobacillus ozensis DSM 23829 = JCM 17196]
MDDKLDVSSGMRDALPTVFGYIGIGLAFGIVAKAAGLNVLLVALVSIITYAGSAQFILVSMLASGNAMLGIVLAVFLVNSRMILMSMTVAPFLKQESMLKNILVGSLLTDESFALSMSKVNYTNKILNFSWLNTANIVSYCTWVLSSILGALLGGFITNPDKLGLNFALVAMFIGLLYLQMIGDKELPFKLQLIVVLIVLGLVYLGLIFIPSNLLIIAVTIVGCSLGMVIKHAFF